MKLEPACIFTVAAYETVALGTGWLPTVTSLVARLPRSVRGLIVAAIAVYLSNHFEVITCHSSRCGMAG